MKGKLLLAYIGPAPSKTSAKAQQEEQGEAPLQLLHNLSKEDAPWPVSRSSPTSTRCTRAPSSVQPRHRSAASPLLQTKKQTRSKQTPPPAQISSGPEGSTSPCQFPRNYSYHHFGCKSNRGKKKPQKFNKCFFHSHLQAQLKLSVPKLKAKMARVQSPQTCEFQTDNFHFLG